MTIGPRAVVVHRTTERQEITRQAGTWGHAQFQQRSRGVSLDAVQQRSERTDSALQVVSAAIPNGWRRGAVERGDLDRFLFEPQDVVIVVGQDGLVANTAKYLEGQPVIGINTDPGAAMGVLVRHAADQCARLLAAVDEGRARTERRTMVAAQAGAGQQLTALNEVYVGHAGHQSARYRLALADGRAEAQSSSGLLVGTGTGATGWLGSIAHDRAAPVSLPEPEDPTLAWFVREAWPSPVTGTDLTEGLLAADAALRLVVQSESLTVFGDGMEADHLTATWGETVTVQSAAQRLHLVL